ncbi:MAG TPA: hypothetical protein VGK92_00090 [Gaiellales bacterium]
MASREQALAQALDGLDPETRQALARALERGEVELEGGDWGSVDDGSGCLLSLAAWELGLERGESLMRRSVAAVQVPALFDAWWDEVLTREGDVVRTRRSVREALGEMLFQGLAAPRDELPQRAASAADAAGVGAAGDDGAVGAQVGAGSVVGRA